MNQVPLFISHGAPDIIFRPEHPTFRFWQQLGSVIQRPAAIIVVSAHWCTGTVQVSMGLHHTASHDFGGFDARLFDVRYDPPGSPEYGEAVVSLLRQADIKALPVEHPGLDHGIWIPLSAMFPAADIPVVPVSVVPFRSPEYHYRLGAAMSSLARENVLIIGSGALTHNLQGLMRYAYDAPAPPWVDGFSSWMIDRLALAENEELFVYRQLAPFAERNHPTEEHLLPLFSALGAGGGTHGRLLHTATVYGTVKMDVIGFGEMAVSQRENQTIQRAYV